MSDITKKNLRFSKDYNLPINIFNEEMFSYYRELYKDFWPYNEEQLMEDEIKSFNNNVDVWLESYAHLRDNIINTLENSEEYKAFNSKDLSEYDIPKELNVGEHSIYNEESEGKYFMSIDLKKANFQALKYVGVLNDNTYEDFIKRFSGTEYFAKSKYLRQVIFGKLNPKRQIKVEKYLMSKILKDFTAWNLYSLNSDEAVFLLTEDEMKSLTSQVIEFLENDIKKKLGIIVRIEVVTIKRLPIVNCNGNKVDAYVRHNIVTGEETLKKASTTFYPQIYKLWKGLEINEKDKTFFFEDQLATFNKPLTILKQ